MTRITPHASCLAAMLSAAFCTAAFAEIDGENPRYSIHEIVGLYPAYRMNNLGVVAGRNGVGDDGRAAIWTRAGGVERFNNQIPATANQIPATAVDVNDAGEVLASLGGDVALLQRDGTWVQLLSPIRSSASIHDRNVPPTAVAINANGVVAGSIGKYGAVWHGDSAPALITIDTYDDSEQFIEVRDINDGGVMAGYSGRSGAIWQLGYRYTVVEPTGNADTIEFNAINDSGLVVGTYSTWTNGGFVDSPVYWTESSGLQPIDLSALQLTEGRARVVTEAGVIIGDGKHPDDPFGRRIWFAEAGSPPVDLSPAIENLDDVSTFIAVLDVNELGWVLARSNGRLSVEGEPQPYVLLLPPCSVVDLAPTYGTLDVDDVLTFLGAFASGDAVADLTAPLGVFDIDDLLTFLAEFNAGCPW